MYIKYKHRIPKIKYFQVQSYSSPGLKIEKYEIGVPNSLSNQISAGMFQNEAQGTLAVGWRLLL